MSLEDIRKDLINIVGPDWVSDKYEDRLPYSKDKVTAMGFLPSRMPDFIVMPQTTEQIQKIVVLANRYRIPINQIGAGVHLLCGSIPTTGGITLDYKRMDGLWIDEDNMTVTLEPGVIAVGISGEFRNRVKKGAKKLRPYFPGGPGSSTYMGTLIFQGMNKLVSNKLGQGMAVTTSLEMVMPDGTIFNTGSGALPFGPGKFWQHGPGPDLTMLPFTSWGSYGICTKMTMKLFPIQPDFMPFWATYMNPEPAVEAAIELNHREVGKGLVVTTRWIHCAYSGMNRNEDFRLERAAPTYFLGVALEGTKRHVEHDLKICQKMAQRTKGRIVPMELILVYGGPRANIEGWAQGASPRLMRHHSALTGLFSYNAIDKFPEFANTCDQTVLDTPEWRDHPNPGDGVYNCGAQMYSVLYGQYSLCEYTFALDHDDPKHVAGFAQLMHKLGHLGWKMGQGPYAPLREHEPADLLGNFYTTAERFKRLVDPQNILNPGIGFPNL
jgi:FAD/FMN-containing dehydrogenase